MGYTYEIIPVTVKHPEAGILKKQVIIYYDENDTELTRMHYEEGKTEIGGGFDPEIKKTLSLRISKK